MNALENSGGGRILNGYQLYLADNAGVNITNKFGIYQVGRALNSFGGNFRIAVTTDTTGIIYMGTATFLHAYDNPAVTGGNLFLGTSAGNLTMTGTGSQASYNIGIGYQSLYNNTTGYSNTGTGFQALSANTTGYGNTAFGKLALSTVQTGNQNTAVGMDALKLATGSNSVAVGYQSLLALSSGSYSTAVGHQALYSNQTGIENVAVGQGAGSSNTGSKNVFVGNRTGYSGGNVSNNTYVGYYAGYSGTGSGNVNIGYRAGYKETGSSRFYVASDSTSWANGMASGSKLLLYGDQSDADKANHFLNIFAKVAIGEAKALSAYSLEVVGDVNITGGLDLGGNLDDADTVKCTVLQADQIKTCA